MQALRNSYDFKHFFSTHLWKKRVILLLYMLAIACNNTPSSNNPLDVLNGTVNLGMIGEVTLEDYQLPWSDFRKKYRNVSIVYLQDGCAPCYPKFINWHKRMEQITKADDYTVLFVINARDYASFTRNTPVYQSIEERYYYFIDPRNEFYRTNSNIPRAVLDRSLLIDRDNRIKMVGEPFLNTDMTKVFHLVTGVDS